MLQGEKPAIPLIDNGRPSRRRRRKGRRKGNSTSRARGEAVGLAKAPLVIPRPPNSPSSDISPGSRRRQIHKVLHGETIRATFAAGNCVRATARGRRRPTAANVLGVITTLCRFSLNSPAGNLFMGANIAPFVMLAPVQFRKVARNLPRRGVHSALTRLKDLEPPADATEGSFSLWTPLAPMRSGRMIGLKGSVEFRTGGLYRCLDFDESQHGPPNLILYPRWMQGRRVIE